MTSRALNGNSRRTCDDLDDFGSQAARCHRKGEDPVEKSPANGFAPPLLFPKDRRFGQPIRELLPSDKTGGQSQFLYRWQHFSPNA